MGLIDLLTWRRTKVWLRCPIDGEVYAAEREDDWTHDADVDGVACGATGRPVQIRV